MGLNGSQVIPKCALVHWHVPCKDLCSVKRTIHEACHWTPGDKESHMTTDVHVVALTHSEVDSHHETYLASSSNVIYETMKWGGPRGEVKLLSSQ